MSPREQWLHVYPVNDICAHETEGPSCVCGPRIDVEHGLVIHHSLDGREKNEAMTLSRLSRPPDESIPSEDWTSTGFEAWCVLVAVAAVMFSAGYWIAALVRG